MSAEFDLLGEVIQKEPTKKSVAKPVHPAPPPRRESVDVPYRPYTITRLSKTSVMLVNDDSASQLK